MPPNSTHEAAGVSVPEILTDSRLDPVFWPPTRVGSMSAWWGHVPFAHWLVTAIRPRVTVELGTHNGVSYAAFCEAIQRENIDGKCFAVDIWEGDEHAGHYDNSVLENLQEFVNAHYGRFAELIRLTFDEAASKFGDGSIDLLHIDGLHTYEAVKGDFTTWLPKLSERGVVLFHDTEVREGGFGVWKFWAEIQERYPTFEFLHGHGLGIAAVGRNAPRPVKDLCLLEQLSASRLRERFAQLGEGWIAADRATILAKEVAQQRILMTEYVGREKQTIAQTKLLAAQIQHQQLQLAFRNRGTFSTLASSDPRDRTIRALKSEIAAIYASNSWRLTKPLRALQTARLRSKRRPLVEKYPDSTAQAASTLLDTLDADLPELRRLADRDTIIVAIHEATRTGGAILGWNIVHELQRRYNVIVLLKRGGPIQATFDQVSSGVVQLANDFQFDELSCRSLIARLAERYAPKYVIANTMETRFFVAAFEERGIPTVALIHEFSASARPLGSLYELFRTASNIVFSAQIVADSALHDYRDLGARAYHILPQGLCKLPGTEQTNNPGMAASGDLTLLPPHDGSIVVAGIGTITMRKGVEYFISAAASIRRQRPDLKVKFVWVGKCYDFEAFYLDFLNEQIRRSQVGDSFTFLGEFDDLEPIYDRADLYFLSSRLDPLPNVAIDSAFRGIPVICFDQASGFAEILAELDTTKALVLPYLDAESAAKLVMELADDRARLAALSDEMKSIARSHFDMTRYVDALDALACSSIEPARLEKTSFDTISKSGRFNARLYCSAQNSKFDEETALRNYVHQSRLAAPRGRPLTGLIVRRPLEGFHPLIYAAENPNFVEAAGEDPLAHYIRHDDPDGPWKHPIIRPRAHLAVPMPELRVAVHGHFHYPELLSDFLKRLAASGHPVDLFLTTTTDEAASTISKILQEFPNQSASVAVVPNRGRDIGPMLTSLPIETLMGYDLIGHFHGKRSPHVDSTTGDSWRNFLWENLLGGDHNMMGAVLEAFAQQPNLGLVFAEDPHLNDWDENREIAEQLARRMGLSLPLPPHFDFPIGTMFWARPHALRPLYNLDLTIEELPIEPLPIDGTLLHALERLIPFAASHQGFYYAATYLERWTR